MTTATDTKLLDQVYTVAQSYGKLVTFSVPGTKVYDPATGKTTEGSVVSHAVKVTPPAGYNHGLVDGDTIQARDLVVILPKKLTTFTPALAMQVTVDAEVFDIVTIRPLYSGADICAWDIQLRQ
tara:strand:+ start:3060 stop:3431 length:372 start_codon:yes stop_codon:yes gene_type:complete